VDTEHIVRLLPTPDPRLQCLAGLGDRQIRRTAQPPWIPHILSGSWRSRLAPASDGLWLVGSRAEHGAQAESPLHPLRRLPV